MYWSHSVRARLRPATWQDERSTAVVLGAHDRCARKGMGEVVDREFLD